MVLSPQQVYQDLLNAGASTTEAEGIMANMINESDFNPEAIGDQGTSFGLVQQHGAYSYLVTGNATNDAIAQIKEMVTLGGLSAASGSTGAQAAGNFAADYERCVGCQPGGSQYEQRVANAATVIGWVTSGNWPQSAGSNTASGTQAQTTGIISSPVNGVVQDVINDILSSLGLGSVKDLVQRLGLILLGAAMVLLGIHLLASGSSNKKQPLNINLTESSSSTGASSKTRTVQGPGFKHSQTRRVAAPKKSRVGKAPSSKSVTSKAGSGLAEGAETAAIV